MPDPSLIFTRPIIAGSGSIKNENCSVELLGLAIYGDFRHGWHLPCIDAGCQELVVWVQDVLPPGVRNSRRWRLLIARLATCHNTGSERVRRRMGLWGARRSERVINDELLKKRVEAYNDLLERWLAGDATDADMDAAASEVLAIGRETLQTVWTMAWMGSGWAAAIYEKDEDKVAYVDEYLTAWHKVAADEGCMVPAEVDEEYEAFLAALDFMEGTQGGGG